MTKTEDSIEAERSKGISAVPYYTVLPSVGMLEMSEKGHEPLTRTEGNTLVLDMKMAIYRAKGPFICCYRSVFRENDGKTDNEVGFGKVCSKFNSTVDIKDDFIKVECRHPNRTVFYAEFHSFIHDHSKVEDRCKKHKNPDYSVMVIGLDALSRMNMHRQLTKTYRYLIENMKAIEMYGFNKVGDNTFPNLVPLLLGYDERELPEVCWKSNHDPLDNCTFLWKRFASAGYRTFYAEDTPHISTFNYVKTGFHRRPTDYYMRPFILAYEDELGRNKRLNCHLCVGSVSETEAILHWNQQFAEHFKDRAYFSFSWINSLTHDFLNMGSSGDHMYEGFFRTLHQGGYLDRTIVIVMGDHGMRWGEIRKTYIGRLEERLPILLIALPEKFKREHPTETRALLLNSHRLVTPFDLHATLVNILHLQPDWSFSNPDNVSVELSNNFTSRAQSLFQPVPKDRSCDDAFIEEHWCTCETSLPMDIDNEDVKEIAEFLVISINRLLSPVSSSCARLKLKKISDARLWQPASEHEGHTAEDSVYTVVVQTAPSDAIFEGTAKLSPDEDQPKLLGTISRLNLYGNQSSCVDDAKYKKYCYCS
ncbi:uncharacterized protein LOC129220863 [Uloborus diversus]|uniref:uncharacterized protein LOC129220863 n=1 Tax=Uloborus diversus TaxID=327109 RepID=UPI00240A967A|nr:uncharacterized protein LOC129220863 [Uloborus diversus]